MQDVEVKWKKTSENEYSMTLKTEKVEPGQYTFMVDEDESISLKTTDGSTFKTTSKYKKVFLQTKNIEDFYYIDKQKIFAVAYSALQQVDKNQQDLQKKVKTLEATIKSLTKRLDALESK